MLKWSSNSYPNGKTDTPIDDAGNDVATNRNDKSTNKSEDLNGACGDNNLLSPPDRTGSRQRRWRHSGSSKSLGAGEKLTSRGSEKVKKRAASSSLPNSPRWKKSMEQLEGSQKKGLMSKVKKMFKRSSSKIRSSKDRSRGSSVPSTPNVCRSFRLQEREYPEKDISPGDGGSKPKSRLLRKMESRKEQRKLIRSLAEQPFSATVMSVQFDEDDGDDECPFLSPSKHKRGSFHGVENHGNSAKVKPTKDSETDQTKDQRMFFSSKGFSMKDKPQHAQGDGSKKHPCLKHSVSMRSSTLNSLMNPFANRKSHKRWSVGSDGSVGLYENHVTTEQLSPRHVTSDVINFDPGNNCDELGSAMEGVCDVFKSSCYSPVSDQASWNSKFTEDKSKLKPSTQFSSASSILSALEYESSVSARQGFEKVKVMPIDASKLIAVRNSLTPPKERSLMKMTTSNSPPPEKSQSLSAEVSKTAKQHGTKNNNNGHHHKKALLPEPLIKTSVFEIGGDSNYTFQEIQIDHMDETHQDLFKCITASTETRNKCIGFSVTGSKERLNVLQSPKSYCSNSPPFPEFIVRDTSECEENSGRLNPSGLFEICGNDDPKQEVLSNHIGIEVSTETIGFSPEEFFTEYEESRESRSDCVDERDKHDEVDVKNHAVDKQSSESDQSSIDSQSKCVTDSQHIIDDSVLGVQSLITDHIFKDDNSSKKSSEMKTFDEVKQNVVYNLTNQAMGIEKEAKLGTDENQARTSGSTTFPQLSSTGSSWATEVTSQYKPYQQQNQNKCSNSSESHSQSNVANIQFNSEPRRHMDESFSCCSGFSTTLDSHEMLMDVDELLGSQTEESSLDDDHDNVELVQSYALDVNTNVPPPGQTELSETKLTDSQKPNDAVLGAESHYDLIDDVEPPSDLVSTLLTPPGCDVSDESRFSLKDIDAVLQPLHIKQGYSSSENTEDYVDAVPSRTSTSESQSMSEVYLDRIVLTDDDVQVSDGSRRVDSHREIHVDQSVVRNNAFCLDYKHLKDSETTNNHGSDVDDKLKGNTEISLAPDSAIQDTVDQSQRREVSSCKETRRGSNNEVLPVVVVGRPSPSSGEEVDYMQKQEVGKTQRSMSSILTEDHVQEMFVFKEKKLQQDEFLMPDAALQEFESLLCQDQVTEKVKKRVSFNLEDETAYISEPTVTSVTSDDRACRSDTITSSDDCAHIGSSTSSCQYSFGILPKEVCQSNGLVDSSLQEGTTKCQTRSPQISKSGSVAKDVVVAPAQDESPGRCLVGESGNETDISEFSFTMNESEPRNAPSNQILSNSSHTVSSSNHIGKVVINNNKITTSSDQTVIDCNIPASNDNHITVTHNKMVANIIQRVTDNDLKKTTANQMPIDTNPRMASNKIITHIGSGYNEVMTDGNKRASGNMIKDSSEIVDNIDQVATRGNQIATDCNPRVATCNHVATTTKQGEPTASIPAVDSTSDDAEMSVRSLSYKCSSGLHVNQDQETPVRPDPSRSKDETPKSWSGISRDFSAASIDDVTWDMSRSCDVRDGDKCDVRDGGKCDNADDISVVSHQSLASVGGQLEKELDKHGKDDFSTKSNSHNGISIHNKDDATYCRSSPLSRKIPSASSYLESPSDVFTKSSPRTNDKCNDRTYLIDDNLTYVTIHKNRGIRNRPMSDMGQGKDEHNDDPSPLSSSRQTSLQCRPVRYVQGNKEEASKESSLKTKPLKAMESKVHVPSVHRSRSVSTRSTSFTGTQIIGRFPEKSEDLRVEKVAQKMRSRMTHQCTDKHATDREIGRHKKYDQFYEQPNGSKGKYICDEDFSDDAIYQSAMLALGKEEEKQFIHMLTNDSECRVCETDRSYNERAMYVIKNGPSVSGNENNAKYPVLGRNDIDGKSLVSGENTHGKIKSYTLRGNPRMEETYRNIHRSTSPDHVREGHSAPSYSLHSEVSQPRPRREGQGRQRGEGKVRGQGYTRQRCRVDNDREGRRTRHSECMGDVRGDHSYLLCDIDQHGCGDKAEGCQRCKKDYNNTRDGGNRVTQYRGRNVTDRLSNGRKRRSLQKEDTDTEGSNSKKQRDKKGKKRGALSSFLSYELPQWFFLTAFFLFQFLAGWLVHRFDK